MTIVRLSTPGTPLPMIVKSFGSLSFTVSRFGAVTVAALWALASLLSG